VSAQVCLTVDVEDWYDGMEVLGERIPRPAEGHTGLPGLAGLLDASQGQDTVTLFVVGNYGPTVAHELEVLAAGGHEIASHGPDHGRLPEDPTALLRWLRQGRTMLEDLVQRPVRGFRSPRFEVPGGQPGLARFRELVAEAGFEYVSDTSLLGGGSPVRELPVLVRHHLPLGGGSYQRLLPVAVTSAVIESAPDPAVLYYHSYDFGATLPGMGSIRSLGMAKQLVGRGRVHTVFASLLRRFGSEACSHAG
jgi:hypothetical protein